MKTEFLPTSYVKQQAWWSFTLHTSCRCMMFYTRKTAFSWYSSISAMTSFFSVSNWGSRKKHSPSHRSRTSCCKFYQALSCVTAETSCTETWSLRTFWSNSKKTLPTRLTRIWTCRLKLLILEWAGILGWTPKLTRMILPLSGTERPKSWSANTTRPLSTSGRLAASCASWWLWSHFFRGSTSFSS